MCRLRRVAIRLDLNWGLRRECEVYAGVQSYAKQANWQCLIDPAVE